MIRASFGKTAAGRLLLGAGVLALLALLTVRIGPLFWLFVAGFNLVGAADIVIDYYHGITLNLGAHAGALGDTKPLQPEVLTPYFQVLTANNRFPEAEKHRRRRGTVRYR